MYFVPLDRQYKVANYRSDLLYKYLSDSLFLLEVKQDCVPSNQQNPRRFGAGRALLTVRAPLPG